MGAPEQLRRGLFGYRTKAVRKALADRESVLRMTQGRADTAERNVAALQGQLAGSRTEAATIRTELHATNTELSAARTEAADRAGEVAVLRADLLARDDLILSLRREFAAKEEAATGLREDIARLEQDVETLRASASSRERATIEYLMKEVSPIVSAAEEAARRITERARRESDRQIDETYRLWRSMQGELARFGMWRDRIEGLVASSRANFEEARIRIDALPERLATALGPLTGAIDAVNDDLARLASTSIPAVVVDLQDDHEHDETDVGTAQVTIPEADAPFRRNAKSFAQPAAGASSNGDAGASERNRPEAANGSDPKERPERLRVRLDWRTPSGS